MKNKIVFIFAICASLASCSLFSKVHESHGLYCCFVPQTSGVLYPTNAPGEAVRVEFTAVLLPLADVKLKVESSPSNFTWIRPN